MRFHLIKDYYLSCDRYQWILCKYFPNAKNKKHKYTIIGYYNDLGEIAKELGGRVANSETINTLDKLNKSLVSTMKVLSERFKELNEKVTKGKLKDV